MRSSPCDQRSAQGPRSRCRRTSGRRPSPIGAPGAANASALARMAFLFSSEMAFRVAADSLHLHGGYGYTLEYDIQLYFRRAKAWPLAFGDPKEGYRALAAGLFEHKER